MRYAATAAQAAANNFILARGEFGYTKDDDCLKVGDGVSHWNDLDCQGGGTSLTTEQVQDIVGAMVTGNTETGIAVTYDDSDGTLDFVVSGGYTDESIQDLIGAMVTGNTETGISVTYDDTAGKLNFVASGSAPTADQIWAAIQPAMVPPGSPNAKDDEFDGTSSVTWTDTPTPATAVSLNGTAPGGLYIATASLGSAVVGRLQAVPGAYPYTITTRVSWSIVRQDFQATGLVLAPSSPTGTSSCYRLGPKFNGVARLVATKSTLAGTFASETTFNLGLVGVPLWVRMTVTSASSVTSKVSKDGVVWKTMYTEDPGITPAWMGLYVADESANNGNESVFDFFRVT
jgi:hypothetical protein